MRQRYSDGWGTTTGGGTKPTGSLVVSRPLPRHLVAASTRGSEDERATCRSTSKGPPFRNDPWRERPSTMQRECCQAGGGERSHAQCPACSARLSLMNPEIVWPTADSWTRRGAAHPPVHPIRAHLPKVGPSSGIRPVPGHGCRGRIRSMTGSPSWTRWVVPLVVVCAAAGVRLWGITSPPSLYWDEQYYVDDAEVYLGGGIGQPIQGAPPVKIADEGTWVHPPGGKWIIALLGVGPFGQSADRLAAAVSALRDRRCGAPLPPGVPPVAFGLVGRLRPRFSWRSTASTSCRAGSRCSTSS